MKTLKKIKLGQICKAELENMKMKALKGGSNCRCKIVDQAVYGYVWVSCYLGEGGCDN